jgi:hypothetical protein
MKPPASHIAASDNRDRFPLLRRLPAGPASTRILGRGSAGPDGTRATRGAVVWRLDASPCAVVPGALYNSFPTSLEDVGFMILIFCSP